MRLAARGLLVYAQAGARASSGLRIIQIGVKTAQGSVYLARAGGGGGGTRGVVGGGGSSRYRSVEDARREIKRWDVQKNLAKSNNWHLDAVRRERLGEILPNSKRMSHFTEVKSAYEGLLNAKRKIDGALQASIWSEEARQFLQAQRQMIDTEAKRMWNALHGPLP